MKIAFDTNVLAYAEGINGGEKRDIVLDLLHRLPKDAAVIPVQVLGELFNVLTRKGGRSRIAAREAILGWRDAFPLAETTPDVMLAAADLAADHHFGIWDAVMLTVASQSGCRLLLSEDLQDGFTWAGTTITSPFAMPRHPLLTSLLDGNREE